MLKVTKTTRGIYRSQAKSFAGGKKKLPISPTLRDFDIIWIGGLNSANMIKYFQHKHFHGKMAGFNPRAKFFNEHMYEYVIGSNMKSFKYLAMPFSSNFEVNDAKCGKDRITKIDAARNQLTTERGDVYNYKALVLNTGLKCSIDNMPFLNNLVHNDPFGKSRVFVHDTSDMAQVDRNLRMFFMHKDGDFIVYLPEFPNRREAYDHWYLALDSYLTRGLMSETHNRGMKIRVVTPNNYLFRFPFANEVIQEEIGNRSMIELHLGMTLTNVTVEEKPHGTDRFAYFKDKDGNEIRLRFGSLALTPSNKKREIYEGNDLADEHGQVTVNPYTLQHNKYENIFAFGDCTNVNTTKSYYATMNQSVVVRNNVWDYVHGNEFKAIYEGYTSFHVNHAIDKLWFFKHTYNFQPTQFNFFLPRALGYVGYKLTNSFEKNFLSKIYQKKANFSYPYLQKDRYFRPLNENQYLKANKIPISDVLVHPNHKPTLSFEGEHHGDHGHDHGHGKKAHKVAAAH